MKKFTLLLSIAFLGFTAFAPHTEHHKTIELGAKAPMVDVKNKDVSGKELSLNDIKKDNGLCVIFSCNTCPFVVGGKDNQGWEGRYNDLFSYCEKYNIGMVLVNSNEAKRTEGDSFEDMQKRAKEQAYKGYYAIDNNSAMANAFGAKTTPHVFLFDTNLDLVYRGAIDDNYKDAEMVDENFLTAAIDNLIAGDKINPADTKATGCSIKRVHH